MKLLEIKNNLIKLSYGENENPIMGRFLVLSSNEKSYVAQFVNLKSDNVNNFAIAKLLFTFTSDGVVDNYDGSIPVMTSELSFLSSAELLDLLPIETPVKFGALAQQDEMLNLDISVFERNFTVFVEHQLHKTTFISNCVRQLFQMKEKSVIIDADNMFEDYPKIEFAKDFKLPLNSAMIDYLFEYELTEVDASTKAVIQDIFYAVQQYIKSLDFEFLPIDNFVDVVANQYKETQMPELALLKNKLLKYRDANVFANTKEEVFAFNEKLEQKNCSIIDLKNIHESLQKEVIMFIHNALNSLDKYVYFFVPLTDGNSDKKLIKELINNNHVFTTILTPHSYKYAGELKNYAENIVLFAPQTPTHDFASYNTFLNKLNMNECIVYGKLTQGIPFILDMTDLDLDLTKEDVLGEKYQFVPKTEDTILVRIDEDGNRILMDNSFVPVEDEESAEEGVTVKNEEVSEQIEQNQSISKIPEISQPPIEVVEEPESELDTSTSEDFNSETAALASENNNDVVIEYPDVSKVMTSANTTQSAATTSETNVAGIIEPVANIMEDSEDLSIQEAPLNDSFEEELSVSDLQSDSLTEDDLSIEDTLEQNDVLTEDDLDFIEDSQVVSSDEFFADSSVNVSSEEIVEEPYEESPYINEQPPVVPVYPADDSTSAISEENLAFSQGDSVSHPRYGRGVIEKIIKYGNKTLCSISFENVGRRLLDPTISEFTKI